MCNSEYFPRYIDRFRAQNPEDAKFVEDDPAASGDFLEHEEAETKKHVNRKGQPTGAR